MIAAMEPQSSAIDRALAELNLLILKLQNDSSSPLNESKPTPEAKQTTQTTSPSAPSSAIPAVALTVPRPGLSAPPSHPASVPNGNGSGGSTKAAKSKPGKGAAAVPPNANEAEANFEKSLLQVALISSIEAHPDSEKLFVCQVDMGAGTTCQVVTGLQKFYRAEELRGRQVAVIRNLKPAKLAGCVSEAMILAGAVHIEGGNEVVKVVHVPAGAGVGDRIYLQGGAASDSPPKQLSSKIWEKIVALLKVKGGEATFDGKPLVTSAGVVTVSDLPDGAGIH